MLPVHDLLERTAADNPDKEAVVCGNDRISYSAVDEATTALAAFLASRGIGAGDRVGIFGSKSVEEVIAIFGILRAGAAFVHINPQYRDTHLRHVVADCGIRTLFIDSSRARVLTGACGEQGTLDRVISLSAETKLQQGVFPEIETLSNILQEHRGGSFTRV